jgi:hypothetical protein
MYGFEIFHPLTSPAQRRLATNPNFVRPILLQLSVPTVEIPPENSEKRLLFLAPYGSNPPY